MHPELEESSRVAGSTWAGTLLRITLPLVKPGMQAGWMTLFIVFLREFGISLFLYSPGNEVVSIMLCEFWENGDMMRASALSIVLMVVTVISIIVMRRRKKEALEWVVDSRDLGYQVYSTSREAFGSDQKVTLSIRPEHIELFSEAPQEKLNIIKGQIERTTYIGEYSDILIRVNSAVLRVHCSTHLLFKENEPVFLSFPPERCNLLAR